MSFSWPDEEEVGFSLNGCIVSGEEDGAANEMKLTFLLLHPVSVDNPDGDGAASLDNKIVRLGGREVLFSKTYHQPRSSRQGGALHLALMIPEQAAVGGGSGSVVDTLYKYVEVKNGQKTFINNSPSSLSVAAGLGPSFLAREDPDTPLGRPTSGRETCGGSRR